MDGLSGLLAFSTYPLVAVGCKLVGCKAMKWIHAQSTRPQSGYTTRRIVAHPKKAPSGPAEFRPFFFATSCVINSVKAIKLVPVKRSALTPELKAFIDHAIVPALVKAYLADREEG